MIIWIVALAVVGLTAVTGWNRGAVRAAISLVGLLVAALLAMPIGNLIKPLTPFVGFGHPFTQAFAAPIIAFFVVTILFKVGAHQVFTKIEYWLRYKTTELQRVMYERMNSRVGACVGAINGLIYVIALLVPFYVASYATLQIPFGDSTPLVVKVVNAIGSDLRAAKLGNVAAGFAPASAAYYEAADIVGLLANNYSLRGRLSRYPAFLEFGSRPEFQAISEDQDLQRTLAEDPPLSQVLENDKIMAVTTNRALAVELQKMVSLDEMKDLKTYLKTGSSPKGGDERILGLWVLSIEASSAELKKKDPQVTSRDLMKFKSQVYSSFPVAHLVATADNKAVFKVAEATANPPIPVPSLRGEWKKSAGGYVLKMTTGGSEWKASVVGDEMFVTLGESENALVFKRVP